MYKLFLCLRYLRKLVMAYFAVLCVALCVAMMLIVVSVMNGFLDKIERAAKGLFGDVIVSAPGSSGLARYDEFIAEVETYEKELGVDSMVLRVVFPGMEQWKAMETIRMIGEKVIPYFSEKK